MGSTTQPKRCAVTGANGYVGGRIASHLANAGWSVHRLGRQGDRESRFRLGEPLAPDALRGCNALVHCAYDFAPLEWRDIHEINVLGTKRLFDAAREAGVQRIVLISTISAFEGCRSRYGRAKLEMEQAALAMGGCVIRPGLVYGPEAGGMFGRLSEQAKNAPLVPIPAGGTTLQYLVHHDDLASAVLASLDMQNAPATPVTVAHEQPWSLRDIILAIGRAHDRRPVLVPVPWWLVWTGLRTLEAVGAPIGMRSDSLVSLVYQNPTPALNAKEKLGVDCRAFSDASARAG